MEKKRRENKKLKDLDLRGTNAYLYEKISIKKYTSEREGVRIQCFDIDPRFGSGCVYCLKTNDIHLTLSRFKLKRDITYVQSLKNESIHMNCMLTGEKIIQIGNHQELSMESRESFMAAIKDYEGSITLFDKKPFAEVKITLPITFLIDHGIVTSYKLKALSEDHLMLPITEELFYVLENLERKIISGIVNKIYLNAKVLELMALFMESYKSNKGRIKLGNDKTLKKLYQIKEIIKSNLNKNLSLNELATEVGVNCHTLNNEFLRVFGCTVHEFSVAEKMSSAKYLLENTQKMVYQIAEDVGYKNATHFSAAFKRIYKMTPKAYRIKT